MQVQAQSLHAKLPAGTSKGAIIKAQFTSVEASIDTAPQQASKELAKVLPLLQQTNYGLYWGLYHKLCGKIASKMNEPE